MPHNPSASVPYRIRDTESDQDQEPAVIFKAACTAVAAGKRNRERDSQYTGWYRHITLSMFAHAFLSVIRSKKGAHNQAPTN